MWRFYFYHVFPLAYLNNFQYSESKGSVKAAFTCLRHCIGPLPLTRSLEADAAAPAEPETPKSDKDEKVKGEAVVQILPRQKFNEILSAGPKVLADGTYASQAAVTESPKPGFGSEVMVSELALFSST